MKTSISSAHFYLKESFDKLNENWEAFSVRTLDRLGPFPLTSLFGLKNPFPIIFKRKGVLSVALLSVENYFFLELLANWLPLRSFAFYLGARVCNESLTHTWDYLLYEQEMIILLFIRLGKFS